MMPNKLTSPKKRKAFGPVCLAAARKKQETPENDETLTIRVSNFPEVIQISVEKDVNTSAPADVSERLLKLIHDNMK